MPVKIYREKADDDHEDVAWLCDGSWDLADQIYALEEWLISEGVKLESAEYVADVGLSIRKGGTGGGAALTPKAMSIMADKGMHLLLSEYPSD